MRKTYSLLIMLGFILVVPFFRTYSQVGINASGSQPDPSAMLDVKSTTKGVLLPRMTLAEIEVIADPANGLVVFNTTDNKFYAYLSGSGLWKEILYGAASIAPGCGTITVNHVAGSVAPVTKTVTYGTVKNIPGAPSKCWITSNLGADRQATSVDDATEGSAGWYWQFNHKQGYKHDGTTRTPDTPWESLINENFDWQAVNDPCTIELGGAWRLPSYTEWTNVDASGSWTNWDGPWSSGLKLHASGYLQGGLLGDRGVYGSYWSSTRSYAYEGWMLVFDCCSGSDMYSNSLAYGLSLRCLRDN
jgi:hypothetical protein